MSESLEAPKAVIATECFWLARDTFSQPNNDNKGMLCARLESYHVLKSPSIRA